MTTDRPSIDIWHVAFPVGDLDRSIDFYCRALGFRQISRDAESAFVRLAAGGFTLEFLSTKHPSAARPDHLAFEADDLAVLRERLIADGIEIGEIVRIGPRAARMALMDPDGLRIDLFEARDEIEAWMIAETAKAESQP